MIVGNGNIADAVKELPGAIGRKDVIYFASGVSNSAEFVEAEYMRERRLLLDQDSTKHCVYFSSLSTYRLNDTYNYHKRNMEQLVKNKFHSYTIVRIEVIAWGKNPTTIHNVFRRKLAEGEPIEIRPAFRYIVTKEEFLYWLGLIPVGRCTEMNIPGTRYDVLDILKMVKEGKL